MDRYKKLNILECVPVIQGEGRSTGFPMILIRLAGCNLNCMFTGSICDSEETSWNHDVKKSKKISLIDIETVFLTNTHIKHVMITGGQPTLNRKLFKAVVEVCKKFGKIIEIEDNGTTFHEDYLDLDIDLISMSPKLNNSIPIPGVWVNEIQRETTKFDEAKHRRSYRNVESMKSWIQNFDYQLKFVISDEEEIKEAIDLALEIGADEDKIYFMPEGVTREELGSRRKWLYERCLEIGVKYTDRLHILVYDNLKGV